MFAISPIYATAHKERGNGCASLRTMAHLALLEDFANRGIRRERLFRDPHDLLDYDDDWLISRFRLPRAVFLDLCAELRPLLERPTRRNCGISVPTQHLSTLGFLATGSFQGKIADR